MRLYRVFLSVINHLNFLGPLALRLYLAPILIAAGLHKFNNFDSIVSWFGNPEWGLGLPFPTMMASLATATELIGGCALLIGLGVRIFAGPLMITMLVAAFTAHWGNGWFAIAPANPATNMASVLAPAGFPGAKESLENSKDVGARLSKAKSILREHGNYSWLTEKGSIVILNNGIEFAATYFIMLMMLLFYGPGRFISIDYWLAKKWNLPRE